MCVITMELHNIYGGCNFVIHATYLLTFMAYKYNELQVSFITQKLNCKASCKIPFLHNIVHCSTDVINDYNCDIWKY
jgi:hypothetical protein